MTGLLEQWEDDCERLSEPHKQWQKRNSEFGRGDCVSCYGDEEVTHRIRHNLEVRRIESLELPFDYDDAVNGGKVQLNIGFGEENWVDADFQEKIDYQHDNDRYLVSGEDCDSAHLRMKESRLKST